MGEPNNYKSGTQTNRVAAIEIASGGPLAGRLPARALSRLPGGSD